MGYHVIGHAYPSWDKQRTKQSSVCGVRVDTVHYWKRKLPFGKILGETFVRRVLVLGETGCYAEIGANLIIPKIHIVVPYLKVDPN